MKTKRIAKLTAVLLFLAFFVSAAPVHGFLTPTSTNGSMEQFIGSLFGNYGNQGKAASIDLSPLSFLNGSYGSVGYWPPQNEVKYPVPSAPVPEPGTMLLLGISAAAGAGYFVRRQRRI